MRAPLAAALLALAVALAGCLGSPTVTPDPTPTAGPAPEDFPELVPVTAEEAGIVAPPRISTWPFEGHLTAAAGMSGFGYVTPTGSQDNHAYLFQVEPEAVTMIVELRWADRMADLDLELAAPGCDTTSGVGPCLFAQDGAPGSGDTPLRFVVTEPAVLNLTGDWELYVWAKSAVNADFDGVISVFYGLPPSEDYTALA